MSNDILFETNNNLAIITLNRPKALNALSYDMFLQLQEKLTQWENNAAIKAVLVRSNCEKAFCAGGDIRAVYENKDKREAINAFFQLEYDVNKMIFHYSKPYIALIHGITMGGGIGISTPGSNCVAADTLRWAMPETTIGFFPDVGATYYLSRLPYFIGVYLGLTSHAISATDALRLKLINQVVPYDQFDVIEKRLTEENFAADDFNRVTEIINSFQSTPDDINDLPLEKIAACFCFSSIEEIMNALQNDNSEWSQETITQLLQRSPTSLKVTLHQLNLAKNKSFDEVIAMDLHIARIMLENHDFYEGVRAALIDRDKNPQWEPETLSDVTEESIKRYF